MGLPGVIARLRAPHVPGNEEMWYVRSGYAVFLEAKVSLRLQAVEAAEGMRRTSLQGKAVAAVILHFLREVGGKQEGYLRNQTSPRCVRWSMPKAQNY